MRNGLVQEEVETMGIAFLTSGAGLMNCTAAR